ncbi:hypothetical protein SAY86_029832 [Trapa natans]|uniref:Longin domain-containing protein n=1 Tax=Trapa natans TaxID=22666 RepID=A0AAN7RGJ1_TRANT|nr:hypothetical protein SAY86_029832 [Trapa natans]
MSQKGLIYSFVSKGTVVLAEHTSYSGNFSTIAVQCLQRLPSNNSKYTYSCDGHTFNFLSDSGFGMYLLLCLMYYAIQLKMLSVSIFYCWHAVFLVVADETIGRGVPFIFLERVKDDFRKRYGASIASAEKETDPLADDDEIDDLFEDRFSIAYNLDREFGPILKEHMQYCMSHPEEIKTREEPAKKDVASEFTDEAYGGRSNPGDNNLTLALCVWWFQVLMQQGTIV